MEGIPAAARMPWRQASFHDREDVDLGALGGTRTPNLLIRSQMLYPLSYERRRTPHSVRHFAPGAAVEAAQARGQGLRLPSQGDHSEHKVHITRRMPRQCS